jgi:hypothetical protein
MNAGKGRRIRLSPGQSRNRLLEGVLMLLKEAISWLHYRSIVVNNFSGAKQKFVEEASKHLKF